MRRHAWNSDLEPKVGTRLLTNCISLDLLPPNNSHHQDYYIFSRESLQTFICDCFVIVTGQGDNLEYITKHVCPKNPDHSRMAILKTPKRPLRNTVSFTLRLEGPTGDS